MNDGVLGVYLRHSARHWRMMNADVLLLFAVPT